MKLLAILDMAITALGIVAEFTSWSGDEKIAAELGGMVKRLREFRGQKVFKAQIEQGRVKKQW